MTDTLTPIDQPDPEPKIDFNSPENVLIRVVGDEFATHWGNHSIESCTILGGADDNVMGAASYEQAYGSFLDYTIQDMIGCPGAGWFVVEGVTAEFFKGDGYTSDDDMRFDYKLVRPATAEEREMA